MLLLAERKPNINKSALSHCALIDWQPLAVKLHFIVSHDASRPVFMEIPDLFHKLKTAF